MKKRKKDAANFLQLGKTQLGKVNGGYWVEIIDGDGKKTTIWV